MANLGRRGRANKDLRGFNLDLIKGRWLSENPRPQEEPDDDFEANQADVQVKARVTPFVEDRRNIAVLRWVDPVDEMTAVTAQYALERGLEATFQLEDSELASELLPDNGNRGRVLLIEAAEGGAGVLRRLATEPDALTRAATEALRICHINPETGAEDDDACVRGCYRCLLTYGNQTAHERIDRRAIIPLLTALATGTTHLEEPAPATAPTPRPRQSRPLAHQCRTHTGSRVEELIALMTDRQLAGAVAARRHRRWRPPRCRVRRPACCRGVRRAAPGRHRHPRPGDGRVEHRRGPRGCRPRRRGRRQPERLRAGPPMTVPTRPVPEFQIGSLVRARGREWVVLPASTPTC